MPSGASEPGNVSRLYCGLVRERGTVRTSTTSVTSASRSMATNSSSGRVEWPMVWNGWRMKGRGLWGGLLHLGELAPQRAPLLGAFRGVDLVRARHAPDMVRRPDALKGASARSWLDPSSP